MSAIETLSGQINDADPLQNAATRWGMVADLGRCVGCQTCTAACKHANSTAPGVQWRKVLDFEVGEFPRVARAFVPVGCMHCDDPPCMDVCPSKATKKRDDGLVTIDYEICIGCAYCAVACPYQARWRVDAPNAAYGSDPMLHEVENEHPERRSVAQKCTFCVDRIDMGIEMGLVPGVDHEATPACVNSCIAGALHFGNLNDPESNVSKLLVQNKHFTMHEDLGTGANIHYLWDRGINEQTVSKPPPLIAKPVGLESVSPQLQTSWDWRAAANFIGGGTGTALFAATAIASSYLSDEWSSTIAMIAQLALSLVGIGLFCVWLEIGRPWRLLNVFFHPTLSWMTREAMAATVFFPLAIGALVSFSQTVWLISAATGIIFLYCQGRILQAARGIAAWRQQGIVPLIMATGFAEGVGLFGAIGAFVLLADADFDAELLKGTSMVLALLILVRYFTWVNYRKNLGNAGAPTKTFQAFDKGWLGFTFANQTIVFLIAIASFFVPVLLVGAGLIAMLFGWHFKYTLITRAAYNQGYAINRMPVRGAGDSLPGIKPAWTQS